ncbi:MAG: hypothetical protein OEZ14_17180, partial [Acidimicrobiia bacterium]|nr:hypothetical protein [Acidimicrobiia bacterium]
MLQKFEHTFTRNEELTKVKESGPGGTTTMCATYDAASRLTRAWTRSAGDCGTTTTDNAGPEPFQSVYTYNRLGNITSASGTGTVNGSYTYSSGHAHAPSVAGSNTYTYDAAGNRLTAVVGGQTTTSTYDVLGNLASTSGASSAQFLYNAEGERVKRTVGSVSAWYYRDGFELDNTSRETISITLGDMLVATWDVNDRLWSQATDHLGTPTVARSWSGDQEVRRNTPFGSPRSNASAVAGGPSDLSFTGQRDDVGTGLLYFGARYYDPLVGQFTQPDTAEDGLNRYGYAYNNPLRITDPTGEWGFNSIKKAVGSAGSFVVEHKKEIAIVAAIVAVTVVTGGAGAAIAASYGASTVGAAVVGGAVSGAAASVVEQRFTGNGTISARRVARDAAIGGATGGVLAKAGSVFRGWRAARAGAGAADDAVRGATRAATCSFAAGTGVVMADGSTKSIDEIQVGDQVTATDPETGESGGREVTHLSVHGD